MRGVRFLLVAGLCLSLSACSLFKSGKGTGTEGGGEGNIPVAEAGSELKDVNFDYDSASLEMTAKDVLRANSQYLLDNPGKSVTVEGHCDERGTNEYNMALGMRRAETVVEYLRSLGVEESRMGRVSYGEEIPLNPGHDESAWSQNRRAHFAMK